MIIPHITPFAQWHEYPTTSLEVAIHFANTLDNRRVMHIMSLYDGMYLVKYYC